MITVVEVEVVVDTIDVTVAAVETPEESVVVCVVVVARVDWAVAVLGIVFVVVAVTVWVCVVVVACDPGVASRLQAELRTVGPKVDRSDGVLRVELLVLVAWRFSMSRRRIPAVVVDVVVAESLVVLATR